jgi:DNA invertase Pin-like site-specific DNA recombinase
MRDDWLKLLDMLPGLDVIWLWESSRGSRRLSEWAFFLEECEAHHVKIYVETHGRLYDAANGRDRRTLSEDGVDSEYESSKTSDRVTRDNAAQAQEGKPHGWVAYGYQRTYEDNGKAQRKVTGQIPDPETAPVVREIFARLRAGESLRRVANDLNARGITFRGKPWDERNMRQLALNPAYIAIRIHVPIRSEMIDGRRVKKPRTLSNGGERIDGNWPPLVDKETFYAVHARLTDPSRVTTKPGRAKHLLSRIARCGVCGGELTCVQRKVRKYDENRVMVNTGEREGMYQCRAKGCVRISETGLDEWASGIIIGWLAKPENYTAFGKSDDGQLAAVKTELAEKRQQRDEIAVALGDGVLSVAVASKALTAIEDRIKVLEARERELTTPTALADLIPAGADVASGWALGTLEARREIVRILFSPDMLGVLMVSKRESGRLDASTRVRFERSPDAGE